MLSAAFPHVKYERFAKRPYTGFRKCDIVQCDMKRLFLTFVLLSVIVVSGCGGNGGGSASTGPFRGGIVPVRITQEGANDRDGMFAYAGGDGVTGGWIENAQGKRISDMMQMNYFINRYETTLIGRYSSFVGGNYTLKYIQNGETAGLSFDNISWTLLNNFSGTPWYTYDGRQVTIHFQPLPGGDVKYFMRLLNSSNNFVSRESLATPYSGSIQESITPETGSWWEIHLIADTYENGVLKKRNIHIFPDVFNYYLSHK